MKCSALALLLAAALAASAVIAQEATEPAAATVAAAEPAAAEPTAEPTAAAVVPEPAVPAADEPAATAAAVPTGVTIRPKTFGTSPPLMGLFYVNSLLSITNSTIPLAWTPALHASGIASYTLTWRANTAPLSCSASTSWSRVVLTFNSTPLVYYYNATGLTKNTLYMFRLCATSKVYGVTSSGVVTSAVTKR